MNAGIFGRKNTKGRWTLRGSHGPWHSARNTPKVQTGPAYEFGRAASTQRVSTVLDRSTFEDAPAQPVQSQLEMVGKAARIRTSVGKRALSKGLPRWENVGWAEAGHLARGPRPQAGSPDRQRSNASGSIGVPGGLLHLLWAVGRGTAALAVAENRTAQIALLLTLPRGRGSIHSDRVRPHSGRPVVPRGEWARRRDCAKRIKARTLGPTDLRSSTRSTSHSTLEHPQSSQPTHHVLPRRRLRHPGPPPSCGRHAR